MTVLAIAGVLVILGVVGFAAELKRSWVQGEARLNDETATILGENVDWAKWRQEMGEK